MESNNPTKEPEWLKELPDQTRIVVKRAMANFEEEKKKLYQILPADCLLKRHNSLCIAMVGGINQSLLDLGIYSRSDICSLCTMDMCPWYNRVSYPSLRRLKIKILSLPLRFSKKIGIKILNRTVRWF